MQALLVAAPLAGSSLVGRLFPAAAPTVVTLEALRVSRPWCGELFELLAAAALEAPGVTPRADCAATALDASSVAPASSPPPAGALVGLVVPVRWLARQPAPELVLVADHVNTRLRGPLTGRRPVSGPRSLGPQPFPSLAGLYQPATIRRAAERRVYSVVAVAGVANAAELTPFERRAVAAAGCPAVCDCLVDTAIVAAFYGLKVVACGVPQATDGELTDSEQLTTSTGRCP